MSVFKAKSSNLGRVVAIAGLWLLAAVAPVRGEEPAEPPAPAAAPTPAPGDRSTPRATVVGYLTAGIEGRWEDAAHYLNLGPVPQAEREERGPELARQFKTVLDRTLWVEPELLSNQPEGQLDDGMRRRDRVGVIQAADGPVDVFVDRISLADGSQIWKISSSTVAKIPALDDEFGDGVLGEVLPSVFFESRLLQIQLWQWLGLLALALLAFAVSWFLARVAVALLRPLVARSRTDIDDRVFEAVLGPLRLLFALLIFAAALPALELAVPAHRFFVSVEKVVGVIVATWFVLRIVDVFGHYAEGRLESRGQRAATTLVPLGTRTLKAVVLALAALASLDSFGFDVTAVIAGLGVGGLAVALAAQKTLENLFGGATLIADRPVQVGDFCRFGDKLGTVEEIGMRSTRVRTLDRTLVTVPNAEFSTLQLENFSLRDKIWYHPKIGLRYETTPDQLRWVLVEIRKMLYAHPRVDPDPARIRFTGFGDFSLDLEIFCYVLATDYGEYLEIAEDVNLRIMDIVEASGTGFAFPSSTTYVARDEGLDERRGAEAEAAVRRWREGAELPLPGFTPAQIARLEGTIEFPPRGSAVAHRPEAREETRIGEE